MGFGRLGLRTSDRLSVIVDTSTRCRRNRQSRCEWEDRGGKCPGVLAFCGS